MKMRKEVNVIRYISLLFVLFTISMCSTIKEVNREPLSTKYEIKRLKSKSGFSKIIVKSYIDDEYKDIQVLSTVIVNDIYLASTSIKDSMFTEIKVRPSKKYRIKVFSPGLLTLKIKDLYIKERDSIIVNAYLKEDNRPTYD